MSVENIAIKDLTGTFEAMNKKETAIQGKVTQTPVCFGEFGNETFVPRAVEGKEGTDVFQYLNGISGEIAKKVKTVSQPLTQKIKLLIDKIKDFFLPLSENFRNPLTEMEK